MDFRAAYDVKGNFDYGASYGPGDGICEGRLLASKDNFLIGIVEDISNGKKPGTKKYALGKIHEKGLSLLKIAPLQRGILPVLWTLERKDQGYAGYWSALQLDSSLVELTVLPDLQSFARLDDRHSAMKCLDMNHFDIGMRYGREDNRVVVLNLIDTNLVFVRKELRL